MEWNDLIQRDSGVLTSWLDFLTQERALLLDQLRTAPLELSNDQLLRRDASIRGQLKLLDKLEHLATVKDREKASRAYYDALVKQE